MLNNRQHYPDQIILSANVTDENLQSAMAYLLSGDAKSGCKIRLNDNLFTPAQLDMVLQALADPRCPSGIELFFDNCHFTNAYADKFAVLFDAGQYPANMRLHFFGNSIGDEGLFAMVDALSRENNRPGVFLNMQRNHLLTNECIDALTTLMTWNKVADGFGIDLRNNPALHCKPLQMLAKSIEKNTAVIELSMELITDEMIDDAFDNRDLGQFLQFDAQLAALKFCCERNKLLQKFRGNPDFIYQIYRLSAARGMPLPCPPAEENHAPSLRFFAANAVPPAALQAFFDRFEGGFESLRDLTESMQNNTNQLDPDSKKRGCPWPCTIL